MNWTFSQYLQLLLLLKYTPMIFLLNKTESRFIHKLHIGLIPWQFWKRKLAKNQLEVTDSIAVRTEFKKSSFSCGKQSQQQVYGIDQKNAFAGLTHKEIDSLGWI